MLYAHMYRHGKISKKAIMAKARKHDGMIKVGETNGATCSIFAKRKDVDSDEEEDDFEGVVNVSHNIYVNILFTKIDYFAGHEFGSPTDFVTLTQLEYFKLNDALLKYLKKKGIDVEIYPPPHAEALSDFDEEEDEEHIEPVVPLALYAGKKKHGGKVVKGAVTAPPAPKKRGRKTVKRGKKNQSDDEDCGFNEDAQMHICKCKDCLMKAIGKGK